MNVTSLEVYELLMLILTAAGMGFRLGYFVGNSRGPRRNKK